MISENEYKITDVPWEIVLEPTSRCNLKCKFCYNKHKPLSEELDVWKWKKIIKAIHDFGIKSIRISGGEPLLYHDIFLLMNYAHSKGLSIGLNTNGTLIRDEIVKKIEKYVDWVLISLHGHNDLTESKLTGVPDSFEKKIKAIGLLKKNGFKNIDICTTVTKMNIKNLDNIYKVIKPLNIRNWIITRPIIFDKNFMLNRKDIKYLVERMLIYKKHLQCHFANAIAFCAYDHEKILELSNTSDGMIGGRWDDGSVRFCISPDGTAKPNYNIDIDMGDFLEEGIFGCWNNQFIKKLRSSSCLPEQCKNCKYIKNCRGGLKSVKKTGKNYDILIDPLASTQVK